MSNVKLENVREPLESFWQSIIANIVIVSNVSSLWGGATSTCGGIFLRVYPEVYQVSGRVPHSRTW